MQKHIIITGASRGIGFETTKYLADKNVTVTAVARSGKKLSLLEEYNSAFIHTLSLDITTKDASEIIYRHLKEHNLTIDGMIHNAGLLINKPFSELTDLDWDNQFRVNVLAPVSLTRNLLPMFNSGSHILNISSMGGFQGSDKFPGLSAYSATKGALSILTECLATELAEFNISSNCLCLGAVQTEMLNQAFPGFKAPVKPVQMAEYIANFCLNGHTFYNGKILPVALSNPS